MIAAGFPKDMPPSRRSHWPVVRDVHRIVHYAQHEYDTFSLAHDVQQKMSRCFAGLTKRLCSRPYPGDVVVLDNLRPHHAPVVRELIEAEGARLVLMPPYRPGFSPIEPCWSFVKHHLRRLGSRLHGDWSHLSESIAARSSG
jgi:hypothetical protein